MSKLVANSVQLGQSATPSQNFTLSVPSPQDGTLKLSRNTSPTATDILTVNGSGVVNFANPPTGTNPGKVLQVVGPAINTTAAGNGGFSTNSVSYVDLANLSLNVTPSSASSKVLVQSVINGRNTASVYTGFKIVRTISGSPVDVATGVPYGSSRREATSVFADSVGTSIVLMALDSPSTTSVINYKIQVARDLSSYAFELNQQTSSDAYYNFIGSSSLILMEVLP